MRPIGIYLHFPFCKQKCSYCDFNSYSGLEGLMGPYTDALIRQIEAADKGIAVRSLFFGGGTPSLLPPERLVDVLETVRRQFMLLPETEITLEANPATVTSEALEQLYRAGFNRLSIGLQASQDRLLQEIGRIHRWSDFLETFHMARKIGFTNISVDLIFGLPGQTVTDWKETLAAVTVLEPEHLSAYGLQLEEGTPLWERVERGMVKLPAEEEISAMMEWTMKFLPDAGYQHYEISNYAKSGHVSRHNLGYWLGEDYLGFGAGATSTYKGRRWTHLEDPEEYIQRIAAGQSTIAEEEILDPATRTEERLLLGLRLRSGIDLGEWKEQYSFDLRPLLEGPLEYLVDEGWVEITDDRLRLTDEGVLISNTVIAKLLSEI
ncbi:MAG TPA: radical SAM family heme chaperone HemW [Bacillota bacterium]|nr:radical SAM family heme chaperone HemW [Bacillota bacterium]